MVYCVHVLRYSGVRSTRQCNHCTFISTCYFTQDGATPLYVASQNGHSDIVNILIRNGADVDLACEVSY